MYKLSNKYTGVCLYEGTLQECFEYIQINQYSNVYINID